MAVACRSELVGSVGQEGWDRFCPWRARSQHVLLLFLLLLLHRFVCSGAFWRVLVVPARTWRDRDININTDTDVGVEINVDIDIH